MPAKLRRGRPRIVEEHIKVSIQFSGWDYFYSLSPDDGRHLFGESAYVQILRLRLKGPLLEPKSLGPREVVVDLMGEPGMLEERYEEPRKGIGLLSSGAGTLDAYVPVPMERIPELLTLVTTGRIRTCTLTCERLRYRKAIVQDFTVSTTDEDDE